MEQEKELLHSQTAWFNEELKAKSEELLSLSRQKGNEILELKCSLENKEDEARPLLFWGFFVLFLFFFEMLISEEVCRASSDSEITCLGLLL